MRRVVLGVVLAAVGVAVVWWRWPDGRRRKPTGPGQGHGHGHGQGVVDADAELLEVAEVAAGATHTCALRGGAVWCWGAQVDGAVGGAPGEVVALPRRVPGLGQVGAIAAGAGFSCALVDGDVWCWGTLGTRLDAPVRVARGWTTLAAGRSAACGVDRAGGLWCWDGTQVKTVALARARAVALAVGGWIACAIDADAAVWCWGDGAPARVAGVSGARAVAAGGRFACARDGAAAVWCWDARSAPHRVLDGAGALAAGDEFACAVADGGVRCWGDNVHGQLGDGSIEGRDGATLVLDVAGAQHVAAGAQHACAAVGAAVLCWGSDGWRQLGRGGPPVPQGDVERVRPLPELVRFP